MDDSSLAVPNDHITWGDLESQVRSFAEHLAAAKGGALIEWTAETLDQALQWAQYLEEIAASVPQKEHDVWNVELRRRFPSGHWSSLSGLACAKQQVVRAVLRSRYFSAHPERDELLEALVVAEKSSSEETSGESSKEPNPQRRMPRPWAGWRTVRADEVRFGRPGAGATGSEDLFVGAASERVEKVAKRKILRDIAKLRRLESSVPAKEAKLESFRWPVAPKDEALERCRRCRVLLPPRWIRSSAQGTHCRNCAQRMLPKVVRRRAIARLLIEKVVESESNRERILDKFRRAVLAEHDSQKKETNSDEVRESMRELACWVIVELSRHKLTTESELLSRKLFDGQEGAFDQIEPAVLAVAAAYCDFVRDGYIAHLLKTGSEAAAEFLRTGNREVLVKPCIGIWELTSGDRAVAVCAYRCVTSSGLASMVEGLIA